MWREVRGSNNFPRISAQDSFWKYSLKYCERLSGSMICYLLLWQLIAFIFFKPPLEPGTVLYEAELSQFAEDIKKWKERYVVVKNDFAVESYENKEVRHFLVTTDSCNFLKCWLGWLTSPLLWDWLIQWALTDSGIHFSQQIFIVGYSRF